MVTPIGPVQHMEQVSKPCPVCGTPTKSKWGVCQKTRECRAELSHRKQPQRSAQERTAREGVIYPDRAVFSKDDRERQVKPLPLVPPQAVAGGEYAIVTLYGEVAAGRVAIIDASDADLVAPYRWRVRDKNKRGAYAVAWKSTCPYVEVTMHGLITGWKLADHKNHDGLDNRRINLREATYRQNTFNTRSRLGSSSQYKGVRRSGRKWVATINGGEGGYKYLGTFLDEEDAARAYDAEAHERFGEFAYLNFP